MERLIELLSRELITVSGHVITVLDLLVVPSILLVGYVITRAGAAWLGRALVSRGVNADLVHLLRRIFYIVAIAVLAITILDVLSVPLTAFAFVSGAVAIGVGFGAQNVINNFISGWILLWERPIRIGDFLEVGDARGVVEEINTRSTRIRRIDGVHLLIPNSQLLENTVVNWTLLDNRVRGTVRVGVAYGSDVRLVEQLLGAAMDEEPEILDDPPQSVIFEDFGDNALVFDCFFWVNADTERGLRRIRSDLRFRISERFGEAGVVIAFPQRDVHLDGTLQLTHAEGSDG